MSPTTSAITIRVSANERAILESAAEKSRTSLSDFVRCRALESAQIDVSNRGIVSIPAKHWDAFVMWVDRPAEAIPALAELVRRTPTWDR